VIEINLECSVCVGGLTYRSTIQQNKSLKEICSIILTSESGKLELGCSSLNCFYTCAPPFKVSVEESNAIFCFFQEDNGVPIHLKGGVTDGLLYRVTMALTVFGKLYIFGLPFWHSFMFVLYQSFVSGYPL